ncbi:MAG TPA: MFS transporter [Caldilineae bacterium]|nr:MFS transporter [Caldilineae bacterium]
MPQAADQVIARRAGALRELWPLGLAMALSLMGDATLYTVLPTHTAEAGIALGAVGVVLSVNRFIRLASNGFAGWLYDRLPDRRRLFLGALWLGVFSTVIYALSPGLPLLLLGRLMWGIAWSGIWVGGNAIVLQMAPPSQRGAWVGIYQLWFFLGAALGYLLGGTLTDAVGYRTALGLGAGVSAMGALAAALSLSTRHTHNRQADASLRPREMGGERPLWRGLTSISPAMWAAAAAHGVNRLVVAGVLSATLGLLVQARVGSSWQGGGWSIGVATVTGGLLAGRTAVSLVGAPLAGVLSDRSGRRWGLLAWSLAAGAMGIGLLALPGWPALIIGPLIGAAAGGSIQALATTLIGDLSAGERHGRGLGVLYTLGDLGSAVGPLAAYALLPVAGLPAIYLGCAALMLIIAGWAAMMHHQHIA